MPIAYADIFRAVALRAKQLGDGFSTDIETFYTAALFQDEVDGVETPRSALKQDILATEAELASMIASSNNQLFKRALATISSDVASGDEIPIEDVHGWRFLGAYDAILNSETGVPLSEQPRQVVERRIANPGSFYKIPRDYFYIDGTIVQHTCENVVFRGCAWDYATQSNLYDTLLSQPVATTFLDTDVINGSDGIIETQAHGYFTGLRVRVSSGGNLPNGLAADTDYFVILISADEYRLATTLANALLGVSINITTAPGPEQGPHTTTPQEGPGGGQSPLPQELAVLWQARVLAQLPQEGWFIPEADFYHRLATEKATDIIEGRITLMNMPAMPNASSRVATAKD